MLYRVTRRGMLNTMMTSMDTYFLWMFVFLFVIILQILNFGSCNVPTAEPEDEYCDCDCDYYDKLVYWENITKINEEKLANMTTEERQQAEKEEAQKLQQEVKEVQGKLVMNSSSLSSSKMKYQSANDDRPSATNMGIIGCVMISMVVLSLVVCDLVSIARHLRPLRQNVGWLFE